MPDAPSVRFDIAHFGELISDPSRVTMLLSLMNGLRRPASELAALAGVSQATGSAHLKKLVQGSLLRVEQIGRHRYFQLRGPAADALEALALHAAPRQVISKPDRERKMFVDARTCYQHLAGRLGVALFAALHEEKLLQTASAGFQLSRRGIARCRSAGFEAARWPDGKPCLDWTERQTHLGGPLGSLLTQEMLRRGWIVRHGQSRVVRVTTRGRKGLSALGLRAAFLLQ
jgi:DNA-binding transcriptional ArsR family regulator